MVFYEFKTTYLASWPWTFRAIKLETDFYDVCQSTRELLEE